MVISQIEFDRGFLPKSFLETKSLGATETRLPGNPSLQHKIRRLSIISQLKLPFLQIFAVPCLMTPEGR